MSSSSASSPGFSSTGTRSPRPGASGCSTLRTGATSTSIVPLSPGWVRSRSTASRRPTVSALGLSRSCGSVSQAGNVSTRRSGTTQRSRSATASASRSPAVTTSTGTPAPGFAAASAAATSGWTGGGAVTASEALPAAATTRPTAGSVRTTSSTPRKVTLILLRGRRPRGTAGVRRGRAPRLVGGPTLCRRAAAPVLRTAPGRGDLAPGPLRRLVVDAPVALGADPLPVQPHPDAGVLGDPGRVLADRLGASTLLRRVALLAVGHGVLAVLGDVQRQTGRPHRLEPVPERAAGRHGLGIVAVPVEAHEVGVRLAGPPGGRVADVVARLGRVPPVGHVDRAPPDGRVRLLHHVVEVPLESDELGAGHVVLRLVERRREDPRGGALRPGTDLGVVAPFGRAAEVAAGRLPGDERPDTGVAVAGR